MNPYFLGIDIGTGSTKAVALNSNGDTLASAQVAYPTFTPVPGFNEQDPELIWQSFIECFRRVTTHMGSSPLAVGLSSAMHSLIPVNDEGFPLYNMITWADARSAAIAHDLRFSERGEELYTITGTPVYAISILSKIIWLRQNMPEVYMQAAKFISIKEFIWFRLFGSYEVDFSLASATGLFDIIRLHWCPVALGLAGIDRSRLSEPVSTGHVRSDLTDTARELLAFGGETSFVIGASDGCLANLGSLSLAEDMAAITIGTSGAVRITSRRPILNFESMTFNYILDEQTFVCGGPVNNGGAALQWLLKDFLKSAVLTEETYSALFTRISTVAAGSGGLVFLPYLAGERAPIWNPQASGVFFNVREGLNQDHFCRAVVEGICFALRQVLEIIEQRSGYITHVQVSGGFTRSVTWLQLLSDIIGKPVTVVHTSDASAVGAVYMAMKSVGFIADYSVIHAPVEQTIEPDLRLSEVYQKNFLIFKKLYPALKEVMHY